MIRRLSVVGVGLFAALSWGCDGAAGGAQVRSANDGADSGGTGSAPAAAQVITLPGAPPGIGFDDLRLVHLPDQPAWIVVPGGRTGNVALIEPASGQVTTIGGFSADAVYGGSHDFGVTSVDGEFDGLFAVDRTSKKVHLIDPLKKKIVGSAALSASPDYVRYFLPFRALWVTEPDAEQIEVFDMPTVGGAEAAYVAGGAPVKSATIQVKGGPESLVFDLRRSRAFTNTWAGSTVVLDPGENKVLATWPNGCEKSRGLAAGEGILFVACAEGKVSALDMDSGKQLGILDTKGPDVDILAYAPALRHLYVPSAKTGALAIVGVSAKGELSLLGSVKAADGSHCVAADESGNAYVCDPAHGAILKIKDPYPATR